MNEKELFWTMFSSIASAIGSLGTCAAVIVALWQTKYTNKKKIKIFFNDNIKLADMNGQLLSEYVGVTIINIGNRPVIISDWSIIQEKNSRMKIMTMIQGVMKVELPKKIDMEETIDLYYEKSFFLNFIVDSVKKKNKLKNRKIKFQITDSTGKKYIIYSKKTYGEYLLDAR